MRRETFHRINLPNVSVRIMGDVLRGAGFDNDIAFKAARLSPGVAEQLGATVSGVEELRFQRAFAELTANRPDLWILAGSCYSLLTLDDIGLTMLSAPCLKDMLDVVHLGEMGFTLSIFSSLSESDRGTGLEMSLDDVPNDLREFTACRDVTLATRALNHIWGGVFPLKSVELELPEKFAAFFAFIRAPLTFGADTTRLLWAPELLNQPLPQANQFLYRTYLAKARERISLLDAADDIGGHVEHALDSSLPNILTISEVASKLGRSSRALQRELEARNLQFRKLSNQCRIARAQKLLRMTMLPISEISWQVGYGDLSSFSHAFKRVTGETPRQYRTHASGGS